MQKFLTAILFFTMFTLLCVGGWLRNLGRFESLIWPLCISDIFLSIFNVNFGSIILLGSVPAFSKNIRLPLHRLDHSAFLRASGGILFGLFSIIFGIYILVSRIFYTTVCTDLLNYPYPH